MSSQTLPRREFLTSTGAAVALAAIGPPVLFGGTRRAEAGGAGYSQALFEGWQGRDFTLLDEPGGSPLHLADVSAGPASPDLEQFQVSFRAARGSGLPEGTHVLRAPDGRAIPLFLKPTGQGPEGDWLSAEFSLLQPFSANSC